MQKFFTVLVLLSSVAWATNAEDSQRDFERATTLLSQGQEDQALVSFGDYLRRYPASKQSDEAQFFMGEIYFRKKQYYEALKEFRKTQVRGGVDEETLGQATLRAGECWNLLGNPTFAKIEWGAAYRKFPKTKISQLAQDKIGELKQ